MDIQYLCNGSRHDLSEPDFLSIIDEFRSKLSEDDYAKLSGEAYEQPLTVGPVTHGGHTLLFIRWDSGAAVRQYCGADLTEAIAKVPEDSEVHEVPCPQCGTKTTVRKAGLLSLPETDRILGASAA